MSFPALKSMRTQPNNLRAPVPESGIQVNLIIPDISTPDPVIAVENDGRVIYLTLTQLDELRAYTSNADAVSENLLIQSRKNSFHPFTYPLGEQTLQSSSALPNASPYPTELIPADAAKPVLEGTPLLSWESPLKAYGQMEESRWGWRLAVTTTRSSIEVGWADWDNEEGIQNLIELMSDPESLMLIAALTEPRTARLNAATIMLRSTVLSPDSPSSELPPIRTLLTSNHLTTPADYDRNDKARMRKLTATREGVTFSTAVCLQAPRRALPPEEEASFLQSVRGMVKEERLIRIETAQTEARQAWLAAAKQVLEDNGYHVVQLPTPDQGTGNNHLPYLWFTRLPSADWDSISEALIVPARAVRMYSGSLI